MSIGPKLPFAISIPHGGTDIPEEFIPYVEATAACMSEDVDHLTREICGIEPSKVVHFVDFATSRTFVDLNRPPDWIGDSYPDGVVKMRTHSGKNVFREFPPEDKVNVVMERLYHPYHARLKEITSDSEVKLTLDCHSMSPRGLPASPDVPGQERPPICLGHRAGTSATLEMIELLRDIMAQVYAVPERDIWIDKPFNGGYITKEYGSLQTPVIQIEFSRGFYMESQVGHPDPRLTQEEVETWQDRFEETLQGLAKNPIFR